MSNPEETTLTYDERPWPDGPWMAEPDRVLWTDEATGLDCLIRRHQRYGTLCGYVGVPLSHPAVAIYKGLEWEHDFLLDVHGGITYAEECDGDPTMGVCHIPQPGDTDEVFWFGFDMNHGIDMAPAWKKHGFAQGEYRTIEYVKEECRKAAQQLASMT